ncbi:MAG: hypothetical protein WB561_04715 [Terracidiphilus sp.]
MRKYYTAAQSVRAVICALFLVCQTARCVPQQQHQPDFAKDERLSGFLRNYLGEHTDETSTTRYSAAVVDLRDDGKRETIVYLTGSAWCGTGGCTMLILVPEGVTFKVITKVPVMLPPVSVLTGKSSGWHDICLVTGRPLYEAVLSFNGRTYLNKRARRSSDRARGEAVITESTQDVALY